jgi:Kef-type K+ transport system membrane component KefB
MLLDSPLTSFTILLLVSLIVPPLFEKLRLPGSVGLLVAGLALGAEGLGWLDAQSDTMKLLSDIGKIYLMFVAGLEINLADFRRKQNQALGFGVLTFLVPLIVGTTIGLVFQMSWLTSILIGSLLASHTLLGYPIATRLGVARNEAVTVTVGATIFTDIAALLVLAVCLSVNSGEFSVSSLIGKLIALGLYAAIVLFGLDTLGKEYFRRTGNEESNQFLFVLLAVFLASVGAQLLETESIIGAFLAGLAVNDVVGRSPVEEKIEFVGGTLFIPFFFINIGVLLDLKGFTEALTEELMFTVTLVLGLLVSKFLATLVAKVAFRYTWTEMGLMWSLSIPQVAATLAAAFAALGAGVIEPKVFNAVIVMMVVTSVLGPIATAHYGGKLASVTSAADLPIATEESCLLSNRPVTAIVALKNPSHADYLSLLGIALARSGTLVPVAVTVANTPLSNAIVQHTLMRDRQLLDRVEELGQAYELTIRRVSRLERDAATGITHAAYEYNADWIVIGWHETTSVSARLMGNTADALLWSTPCPVAIAALQADPREFKMVVVALENLAAAAIESVRFGQTIAEFSGAELAIIYICATVPIPEILQAFEAALESIGLEAKVLVSVTDRPDVAILEVSNRHDLTVIRSHRFRTAGGLSVQDDLRDVMRLSTGSIVAISVPEEGRDPAIGDTLSGLMF